MKNRLTFLFTILIFTCACNASSPGTESSANGSENSHIQVKIDGYTGGEAKLIGTFTGEQYVIDSTNISADGSMTFKKTGLYEQGLTFIMMPDNKFFPVMIGEDQEFELQSVKSDIQGQMKVNGSIDNELYYSNALYEKQYQSKHKVIKDKLNAIGKDHPDHATTQKMLDDLVAERDNYLSDLSKEHPNSFFVKFKTAGQNPKLKDIRDANGNPDNDAQVYLYKKEFWDNVDFNDDRLLRTPVITNKLRRYMTELTAQNADSIIASASFLVDKVLDKKDYFKYFANWITIHYRPGESTVMDADAVHVHMIQNYFTKERAFWASEYDVEYFQNIASQMSACLIGMKGADMTAKDRNGIDRSISDFTTPYVIVFMYTPGCDHCMEESPKMVEFYKEWKNKGVEIYGIGIDVNDREEWVSFMDDYGMDIFTNVYDPANNVFFNKYFADVTPEIYVLNKDRIIIGKNLKVEQIPTIIARDQQKVR